MQLLALRYLWVAFWWAAINLLPAILTGVAFKLLWVSIGPVVGCWLSMFWCAIFRMFVSRVVTILAPIFFTFPQVGTLDLAPMYQWWMLIDYYVPLTYAMGLLGSLATLVMGMRTFRFMKQFFPGFSN